MANTPAEDAHVFHLYFSFISSEWSNSVGPIFIGWMFNLFFLGMIIVQGYIYMKTYQKDHFWMKTFVAILMLANVFNTIFMAVYLYNTLILKFSDVDHLLTANWLFATDPIMTGLIAGYVQLFFVWRIKVLTGSVLAAAATLVPTVAGFVGSLFSSIMIRKYPRFVEFIEFKAWVIVWLIGETAADLMITFVLGMTFLSDSDDLIHISIIHQNKHKRGFKGSNELVDRIIRSTVQTGLITSIFAIIDLILYLIYPARALHLIFNIPLCKLYSMMLMSSLNSREGWTLGSSGEAQTRSTGNGFSFNGRSTQVVVHVEHEMDRAEGFGEHERDRDTEADSEILDQKGAVFADNLNKQTNTQV
ncbi:hypothetical protein VKT23_011750 [Stygiomarasmius scandens]|uniref:DUF6534 domain-containing protein n=1 Tax=Marasmiellus scandens TaxID=2682957 RepID=A0ABR1J8F1_9AGAR